MRKCTLLVLLLLSGCMVGPNYTPPATTLPCTFHEECGAVCDADPYFWWEELGDPCLNALLEEALEGSPDLHIAWERAYQARCQFLMTMASIFPVINVDGWISRFRNSINNDLGNSIFVGSPFNNFFLTGFDAAWQLDFFGGVRRNARAYYANWEATNFEAGVMQLLVLSEVACNYLLLRGLQEKVLWLTEAVELDGEQLALASELFQAGLGDEEQLQEASSQLSNHQSELAALSALADQGLYAFGMLLGQPPEALAERLRPGGPIPQVSGRVPSGLPSDLLRRRPDIRAAERALAGASEAIGVAVANLFPQFSLTSANLFGAEQNSSNFGYTTNMLGKLFSPGSQTWGLGLMAVWPLIDFGSRIEAIALQNSLYREAALNYHKTVLGALEEVEQALIAYFKEEVRQKALQRALEAERSRASLKRALFEAGLIDRKEWLIAEQERLWAEIERTDSHQRLSCNLVVLYKVLGGEWACCGLP